MAIWFQPRTLEEINARSHGTMMETLDIRFTELGEDSITGTMPVDERTKQPAGLLHGGASVVLAETLASTAANLVVDPARHYCVGLEINANHVRSVTGGRVQGVSRAVHVGKSTQIWETRITQDGKLVGIGRITMAVLERSMNK